MHGQITFHAAAFLETFKEYPPSERGEFHDRCNRKDVDRVVDESFKKRGIDFTWVSIAARFLYWRWFAQSDHLNG